MAKRTNILVTIDREIKNGKTMIDQNGYFVNPEQLEKEVKDAYLKALKDDSSLMENGVTLAQFKETYKSDYLNATEVFDLITSNVFPSQNIFVKAGENEAEPEKENKDVLPEAKTDAEPKQEKTRKGGK